MTKLAPSVRAVHTRGFVQTRRDAFAGEEDDLQYPTFAQMLAMMINGIVRR